MYELTLGDRRFIEDAVTPWKMYIYPIVDMMENVPESVTDRIDELINSYKNDFTAFYISAYDKDETLLANRVMYDFETEWLRDHPEYYDIDKLFSECSDEDKKKAEPEMAKAREAFSSVKE